MVIVIFFNDLANKNLVIGNKDLLKRSTIVNNKNYFVFNSKRFYSTKLSFNLMQANFLINHLSTKTILSSAVMIHMSKRFYPGGKNIGHAAKILESLHKRNPSIVPLSKFSSFNKSTTQQPSDNTDHTNNNTSQIVSTQVHSLDQISNVNNLLKNPVTSLKDKSVKTADDSNVKSIEKLSSIVEELKKRDWNTTLHNTPLSLKNPLPLTIANKFPTINPSLTYSDVTGGYSHSKALMHKLVENPVAFNIMLFNFFKLLYFKWNKDTDLVEQLIVNMENALLGANKFWKEPGICEPMTIFNSEKPYGYIYPFNQHFLFHSFATRLFNIKDIPQKALKMSIDLSQYRDCGITLQNLFEILVFQNGYKKAYDYITQKEGKDNVLITAHNPSFDHKNSQKYFHKHIQDNEDFTITLRYIESGKEKIILADTKLIYYPERKMPSLNGNVSISYDYNFCEDMNKFVQALEALQESNIENIITTNQKRVLNEYVTTFTIDYQKYKIFKNSKNIVLKEQLMKKLLNLKYKMLHDPVIDFIFPSIVTEPMLIDETLYESISLEEQIELYNRLRLDPREYFPAGGYFDKNYLLKIETLIRTLPIKYQARMLEGFETWINLMKTITQ